MNQHKSIHNHIREAEWYSNGTTTKSAKRNSAEHIYGRQWPKVDMVA